MINSGTSCDPLFFKWYDRREHNSNLTSKSMLELEGVAESSEEKALKDKSGLENKDNEFQQQLLLLIN